MSLNRYGKNKTRSAAARTVADRKLAASRTAHNRTKGSAKTKNLLGLKAKRAWKVRGI